MRIRVHAACELLFTIDANMHNAKAFFEQDATWCLAQAKSIGVHCSKVIECLLNHPVKDLLRAAQSVIRLATSYGANRLEQACLRAIHFNTISLHTIKTILKALKP